MSECKAKNPSTCPYHGSSFVLQESAKTGDVERYLKARANVPESKKQEWVQTNLKNSINSIEEERTNGLTSKEYKMLWKRLRGAYLLSELKRMTITNETPVAVTYNRNGEASFDYDTQETQEIFSKGACGYMAYALHEKTGLPIVVFTDDPDQSYWQGHVAVKLGEDKFLDVTGISSTSDYATRYGLNASKYSVEEVHEDSRFRELMGLPSGGSAYAKLNDLEKAILDRCSKDIVRDYV